MRVYEELKIKNKTIKTRIVMPPMATSQSMAEDGHVTEELLTYYQKRAENSNIGMIVTEHCYITKQGIAGAKQLSIADDSDIEGLKRLTECIHENGKIAIAQLNHAGSAADSEVTGMEAVAPSAVWLPRGGVKLVSLPREMDRDGLKCLIESFVNAAVRAKKAGYDGVEIHSAHGYLLNQFYSPLTNCRTDEYGGSLENRLRIHREVIRSVKEAVGSDMLISVRLGGCDYREGGSTISDCVNACKMFEAEEIDLLSLTGGMCRYMREGHNEAGYFKDMSLAVRETVNIPVLLTGGVKTVEDAERLLVEGAADLIGVGRELLKNPNWEC